MLDAVLAGRIGGGLTNSCTWIPSRLDGITSGADSLLLGELGHAQEHLDTFGAEGVRRGAGGGQAGRAAVSGVAKSSAEGPCQELKTRSHMGPIADMKMKEE